MTRENADPPPQDDTTGNSSNSASNTSHRNENFDNANNGNRVLAYAVKLPPFWPEDPEAYFAQIEATFRTSRVTTSRTKYDYLLQALPPRVISDVFDVVRRSATSENPYDDLKAELIKRNTPSESKRLEDLLHGAQIGDKSPSAFYRHLCNLAGSSANFNPDLIRSLWLRRLPQQLEIQLQPFEKENMDSLTMYADGINDVLKRSNSVSAVTTSKVESDISKRLSRLEAMIEKISINHDARPRSRSKFRPRNTSSDPNVCWFHEKWGNKAKNCKGPPCSQFQGTGSTSHRNSKN